MKTPNTASNSNAINKLTSFIKQQDPYAYSLKDIGDTQLEAVRDLFTLRRQQIGVLDKLANDLDINEITSNKDLVPLLFSHQTYKSYPESFVRDNRWALMNKWLQTLTPEDMGEIDVNDVANTDDWIARMAQHDQNVLLSSGTSGKTSFLNRTATDIEFNHDSVVNVIRLMQDIKKEDRIPVFLLGPKNGTHIFVKIMHKFAENFGRDDATYWLSDLELTESDIKRQAELRSKVTDGSVTPGEIQELEASAKERQAQMQGAMSDIAAALKKHKGEQILIAGLWLPHFLFMEAAKEQGLSDGELHSQSTVFVGGGLKGANLPGDYREQLARFHGVDKSRYVQVYGMTELSSPFPMCSAGQYHCPPWIIPLILNTEGTELINQDSGIVEGRAAFFDTAVEARWGGIITSDKVEVDFSPCACGRHSPSIISVSRYSDLPGGDDKLSCAGTMSSYVRGVIEE